MLSLHTDQDAMPCCHTYLLLFSSSFFITYQLMSLVGAATSIIFVFCRGKHVKHIFCRDKSMLVMTNLLSRQNYVCRDKTFLSQQIFVMTNMCMSQQRFCRNKQHMFCHDKHVCRDKRVFVTTKLLSRQNLYLQHQ